MHPHATLASSPSALGKARPGYAELLFLGANTPWVYALAEALAESGNKVSAIATYDSRNFSKLQPKWPLRDKPSGLDREFWVYPPGYCGTLAPLFAPFIRHRLARSRKRLHATPGAIRQGRVITPYPWFVQAVNGVPGDNLIYYNLDDYVLYQPERTDLITKQEAQMISRAGLTLCLSKYQTEALRARYPSRANTIRHFPLGAGENLINRKPSHPPPGRTVGYIGNLIDRVDWRLVRQVAASIPDVQFQFIGALDGFGGGGVNANWAEERTAALALSNVHHLGEVTQDHTAEKYWTFAVNWIPYDTSHAFNRASCPTKIMDGLASGRPVLSTDIPECRLYPEWISIFRSPEQAVTQIQRTLAERGHTAAERATLQVNFVIANHTWQSRAELLSKWLSQDKV